MIFQEFLTSIYQRHSSNIKLGLSRIECILKELGNPHESLKGFHVAGSNGKGSTSAMCQALSLEHGLSCGLNTSPHLLSYLERYKLNGKNIDSQELISVYRKFQTIFEKNEASFFEITTAMAFWLFYKKSVDISIFEVGLGGRLDATNLFVPTISIITSISLDHTKSLGDTLQKIAFEKAGIIKLKTPVVIGKIPEKTYSVFQKIAKKKKALIYSYGRNFVAKNILLDEKGVTFDYHFGETVLKKISLNMFGEHQVYNASCALTAFILYQRKVSCALDSHLLRNALRKIHWEGRMQKLFENPTVILDGAHNIEGIIALVESIKKMFPNSEKYFITSILKDKNLKQMYKKMAEVATKIFFCQNSSKRAADINSQKAIVREVINSWEGVENFSGAFESAKKVAKKSDVIVICGSLYWVGDVLKVLQKK